MTTELSWKAIFNQIIQKQDLDLAEARWAMTQIISNEATPAQVGGFLLALRTKGESVTELSGFVDVLLEHAVKPPLTSDAIDIVGTGGDQLGTVNISTMAAILTAASGYPVLKHGSRSASGKTGSSEMLEALGVNLELTPTQIAKVFDQTGISFFFAPLFHPALKNVGAIRRELGVPTTFNFLGPLANPVQPVATALGVANSQIAPLLAAEMAARGRSALVFRGSDGLDELTTTGSSTIWVVTNGKVTETTFSPAQLGIKQALVSDLIGGDSQANADTARVVLAQNSDLTGEQSAIRDIVALNAAAGITAYALAKGNSGFDLISELAKAFAMCHSAIDDGRAIAKLNEWVSVSQMTGE
jgi:anthranilate phosphoribosyltransferase